MWSDYFETCAEHCNYPDYSCLFDLTLELFQYHRNQYLQHAECYRRIASQIEDCMKPMRNMGLRRQTQDQNKAKVDETVCWYAYSMNAVKLCFVPSSNYKTCYSAYQNATECIHQVSEKECNDRAATFLKNYTDRAAQPITIQCRGFNSNVCSSSSMRLPSSYWLVALLLGIAQYCTWRCLSSYIRLVVSCIVYGIGAHRQVFVQMVSIKNLHGIRTRKELVVVFYQPHSRHGAWNIDNVTRAGISDEQIYTKWESFSFNSSWRNLSVSICLLTFTQLKVPNQYMPLHTTCRPGPPKVPWVSAPRPALFV